MNFNSPIPPAKSDSGLSRFMDRRGFLRNTAMAGGSLLLGTSKSAIAQQTSPDRVMKCALVGCGDQGDRLRSASRDCPNIQWVAVADIWDLNRKVSAAHMGYENKGQVDGKVNQYSTFEELLDKEKDLDCVFIATPDFLHAPFTRMALEKGKAVYCEKLMSNTLEGAKDMVKAQASTGNVLQIGHQRHSNPRYIALREQVYKGAHLLGRVTHAYGQWNRGISASAPRDLKGVTIAKDLLDKYGYASEYEFRNWRYFRKYGGGIIADLGAHQIDLFNWMFEAVPVSLIATGGVDYYDGGANADGTKRPIFELPDNVMVMYEYRLPTGVARAYYQVLTTTGSQGYYEKFMGIDGSAIISESPSSNQVYREPNAPDWDKYSDGPNPIVVRSAASVKNKYWEHSRSWEKPKPPSYDLGTGTDVRESKALDPYELPTVLTRVPHAPHVQNFIEAARAKKPDMVNCTPQMGYNCAVAILNCYKSIDSGAKVELKPEDYKV